MDISKDPFQLDSVQKLDDSNYLLNWQVPKGFAFLEGHFPKNPVLPAISIIDACLKMKAQIQNQESIDQDYVIKRAKFTGLILPERPVIVTCQNKDQNWVFEWVDKSTEKPLANITLVL